MPLPLLAIPGLISAGVGLYQTIKGNKRAKNLQRPTRQVAQGVQEAVANTRYGAQSAQRPGSDRARQNIQTGQASAVSAASKAGGSSAATMAAALGAQQQANQGMAQQDVLDAQFQQQMNTQYLQQLNNLAREQAANWEWNQAQQFQEEADAARRLQESGVQNLMGGIGEVAGMGFMQKMGYLDNAATFGDVFGGGKRKQAFNEGQQALEYLRQGDPQIQGINMPNLPWQAQLKPGTFAN